MFETPIDDLMCSRSPLSKVAICCEFLKDYVHL